MKCRKEHLTKLKLYAYVFLGEVERETGQPYRCNMGAGRACNDIIAAWTVGDEGNCMHPQIGIAIGANGYKKAALQVSKSIILDIITNSKRIGGFV